MAWDQRSHISLLKRAINDVTSARKILITSHKKTDCIFKQLIFFSVSIWGNVKEQHTFWDWVVPVTAVTLYFFFGLHPSRLFPSLFSFTSPCSCPTWHAPLLIAFSLLFLSLPLTFSPHHWPLLLYLPFITSALLLFSHSVCQSSSFLSCHFFSCTAVHVLPLLLPGSISSTSTQSIHHISFPGHSRSILHSYFAFSFFR